MFNRKAKPSDVTAPRTVTPPHRIAFRHQRAIFVFAVLGLVVLFSTAVLWGHFDQIVTSYVWMARAGLAVVDVVAIGLAIWHLYARYAPLKVWCFIGEAIIATTMLIHAGAVLQLDSSGAQATANIRTAAEVQARLDAARVKAAGEAAAAIRLTTGSSRLAGQALQQGAQDKTAAAQIVKAATDLKPTTFLSESYMAGGMFYWPALIALGCFLIAMAISGFALPYEDANRSGIPNHLENFFRSPVRITPGFVAPAQASIPRPRRYARTGSDAVARVTTEPAAAELRAPAEHKLAAELARLGAVKVEDLEPIETPTETATTEEDAASSPPAGARSRARVGARSHAPAKPATGTGREPRAKDKPPTVGGGYWRPNSGGWDFVISVRNPDGSRSRPSLGHLSKSALDDLKRRHKGKALTDALAQWVADREREKL